MAVGSIAALQQCDQFRQPWRYHHCVERQLRGELPHHDHARVGRSKAPILIRSESTGGVTIGTHSVLRLQSITGVENGIEIEFPSQIAQTYRVEYSDDLQSWNAYPTDYLGTGGILQTTIEDAFGQSARFYRLSLIP